MKFGKNLIQVVELSDPEWGPYWINYKFMKKRIKEIVGSQGGNIIAERSKASDPGLIARSSSEVEFFRLLKSEVKKASEFFDNTEQLLRIRKERVWQGYQILQEIGIKYDKNAWTRLLMACVKFYKDVLLLENFAIMNYCGFSKILKKHDKLTGFLTRDAFMRNIMNQQNFAQYPYILSLIKESEKLFADLQVMDSLMPLRDEERLFIDAMRDLNYQANQIRAGENLPDVDGNEFHGASIRTPAADDSDDDELDRYRTQPPTQQNIPTNSISGLNGGRPQRSGSYASSSGVVSNASGDSVVAAAREEKSEVCQTSGISVGASKSSGRLQQTHRHRTRDGVDSDSLSNDESNKDDYSETSSAVAEYSKFDTATQVVMSAAVKLNESQMNSPNLHSIISWMQETTGVNAPSGSSLAANTSTTTKQGDTVRNDQEFPQQTDIQYATHTNSSENVVKSRSVSSTILENDNEKMLVEGSPAKRPRYASFSTANDSMEVKEVTETKGSTPMVCPQ